MTRNLLLALSLFVVGCSGHAIDYQLVGGMELYREDVEAALSTWDSSARVVPESRNTIQFAEPEEVNNLSSTGCADATTKLHAYDYAVDDDVEARIYLSTALLNDRAKFRRLLLHELGHSVPFLEVNTGLGWYHLEQGNVMQASDDGRPDEPTDADWQYVWR